MLIDTGTSDDHATDNPLISVVIPTYNQEDWIVDCLKGVVNQKIEEPFEILLGDDGSTDYTVKRARELLKASGVSYRIYKWKREDNHLINGKPTVLNNCRKLFGLARGKFIAYCEGDDIWVREDKLALQLAAINSAPSIQIVWSNVLRGPNLAEVTKSGSGKKIYAQENFQWSNPCGDAACTAFWRNSMDRDYAEFLNPVLQTVPYWDWPHYLTILDGKEHRGIRISEETAFYRVHAQGGYSGLDEFDRFIEKVQCLNAFQRVFKSLEYGGLKAELERQKKQVSMGVVYKDFQEFLASRGKLISMGFVVKRVIKFLLRTAPR